MAVAVGQWENLMGRAKLALGRLPAGASRVDVKTFDPPDSLFAREAERACAELCPRRSSAIPIGPGCLGARSRRLTEASSISSCSDCGALLHDHGIAQPTGGRDFTLASADRTLACAQAGGVLPDRAELLADAICVHATPGVSPEVDGSLGCYLQWGAMVDGAGLRMWDVAPTNVEEVLRRHPRDDFKWQLIAWMRAEAAAVPAGRFALLARCGLPLAVRMAPFDS